MTAQNNQNFRFGYDATSDKYGYIVKEAGTDVFVPFKSGGENQMLILYTASAGQSNASLAYSQGTLANPSESTFSSGNIPYSSGSRNLNLGSTRYGNTQWSFTTNRKVKNLANNAVYNSGHTFSWSYAAFNNLVLVAVE